MFLPAACAVCERPGASPCPACVAELRRAGPMPAPPGLVWCRSLLELDGAGRELVARLKYRNARGSLRWLAEGMAGLVGEPGRNLGAGPVLVSWAPTTAERRRQRGFDQAELLARAVARCLHLPCRRLLVRRPGPHQTGRSLAERRHGIDFAPTRGARLGGVVAAVLVDDVVTSGSTLSAGARALTGLGITATFGLTAARTP